MRVKSLVFPIALVSLLPINNLYAQSDQKIPVEIVDYSVDVLGRSLVYYVREGIRSMLSRCGGGNIEIAAEQIVVETDRLLIEIRKYLSQ